MKYVSSLNQRGSALVISAVVVLIIVAVAGAFFAIGHKSSSANSGCTSTTLTSGSTGACVRDAQTLANWRAYGIEGTKYTPVTGTFDTATESTVKLAQTNSRLTVTGKVDKTTWSALCQLEDAPASVKTAAKSAGC